MTGIVLHNWEMAVVTVPCSIYTAPEIRERFQRLLGYDADQMLIPDVNQRMQRRTSAIVDVVRRGLGVAVTTHTGTVYYLDLEHMSPAYRKNYVFGDNTHLNTNYNQKWVSTMIEWNAVKK
jgi:hypothetical protein